MGWGMSGKAYEVYQADEGRGIPGRKHHVQVRGMFVDGKKFRWSQGVGVGWGKVLKRSVKNKIQILAASYGRS